MKIPEYVKIGGHLWKVEKVDQQVLGDHMMGDFMSRYQQIRIAHGLVETLEAEVLLHEILEAICCVHQLAFEHRDVQSLAAVLFQVLRDNRLNFHQWDRADGMTGDIADEIAGGGAKLPRPAGARLEIIE